MLSTIKQTYLSRIRCRYLSFIVPLGSILVLLLLCIVLLNPDSRFEFGLSSSDVYADEPALLANNDNNSTPSASLTIASPELSGYGKVGELVTVSSNVTVVGNLINSYSLQISSTNSNTTLEGPSSINPINNTTNPNGVSGNNMPNDTWGYSWNGSNYKGIPTSTNPITIDNTGINSTTGSINYTKPLTFAVKFSQDAIAGHYSTKVNLLLTATPRVLTTYTLSYDTNGGTTPINSTSCSTYFNSCDVTITSTVPTRDSYTFLGWGDSAAIINSNYGSGKVATISGNKTIYAVWKEKIINNYSLTFVDNSNGWTVKLSSGTFSETYPQQTAASSSDSYTFTIPKGSGSLQNSSGCVKNYGGLWSLNEDGTSNDYSGGSQITIYATNPNILLYPYSKGGAMAC